MYIGNDRDDIKKVLDDVDERIGTGFAGRRYEWHAFPQMWGSTALGFGGIGGAAMTTAQTYVVFTYESVFVYFGSRFAYELKGALRWKIEEYMTKKRFPDVREYKKLEKELSDTSTEDSKKPL